MDVYVLLDVLLIILVALFIPIGFWRGAYREAFVTLGILFGASLGRFWGEDWGSELAAVTRLHESGGAFMIAMLCLISATFLLGYSSGAAIPVPEPGWVARILGALIAGANGALLLSFALRDIRVYLLSSEEAGFLDNAVVAPFLSEGTGWILLVAAAVFVPISLVMALFGPDFEDDEYYEDDDFEVYEDHYHEPYAQRTMQLDQRRPPQPAQQAPVRPSPAPAEETRPIPGVPRHQAAPRTQHPGPAPAPQAGPPPPDRSQQTPPDGEEAVETQRRVPQADETQPYRPQMGPQPPLEGPPVPQAVSDTREEEPAASRDDPAFGTHSVDESLDEREIVFGHRQSADQDPGSTQRRPVSACPNCGADISQAEGYCPQCGDRIP